jgi:hypothetical protein
MSPRRLSRREFLAGLGATGVVVASGYGISTWTRGGGSSSPTSTSPRAGRAVEPTSAPARTLVLLELGGGNDGLNMVVPHGDPAYRDLRPTLGITDAIDLDGQIGLSPKLVTLAGEYRASRVAIVEGIAVPNPSLSHFASLQRWWTADPDLHSETGWIGRYLDRAVGRDDPIAGVAIGPGPSPVLAGMTSFSTSIAGADGLQPGRFDDDVRDALLHAWASLVPSTPGNDLVADVQRAIGATLDARVRLARDRDRRQRESRSRRRAHTRGAPGRISGTTARRARARRGRLRHPPGRSRTPSGADGRSRRRGQGVRLDPRRAARDRQRRARDDVGVRAARR